ncbi:hypothetical protein APSETT444_000992 [Aspergillus pseudonomiae]
MEKSAEETGSPGLGTPQSPSQLEQQSDLDLERLGRERPPCFSNIWSELTFGFSIVMSQILAEYYISGSNVLVPTLVKELHIPEASVVWPSTALSLVVTSTLLIFGRLGDMYGGYVLYLAGAGWLTISSILAGFSQTWLMLIICRALQGFALAAFLPSGIMILGSTYRPGPRKNLIFSVYGACAALGFFAGAVLFVFAIAESSYAPQGWKTPYIPVCFCLGVIFLGLMVYMEGWVVENPLLPGDLFAVKYLTPLVIALLLLYGSLGIYFLYAVLYMSDVMGAGPLQIVAWTAPMGVGGLILATAGGFIMHKVSGTLLMLISCIGYAGSGLFFAVIPEGGIYWGFVFPAMICGTVGIDISFNISNIFITTHLPKAKQGLAGALINCTLHFGIAVFLGFADIVKSETEHLGEFKSFKAVFWYETALALVGGLIVVFFVRIHHAKSDLTVEEREALTAESRNT